MYLTTIQDSEFNVYLPMIDRWIAHHDTTDDALLDGNKYDVRSIVVENREKNGIEFMSINDPFPVGIAAHRENGEYLDGVMLWIEPEYRCSVSLFDVFEEILELAKSRGKAGIRFESKVWGNSPEALGFTRAGTKSDGAETVCTWQKNVEA